MHDVELRNSISENLPWPLFFKEGELTIERNFF